jgi:hypothetical protein
MKIRQAWHRAKLRREVKLYEELNRGLVANGWHPVHDVQSAVARHTGIQPRENERIREHLARACGCSAEEVSEWLTLLNSGVSPEQIDVQVFGVTPSPLMGAMKAIDTAVRAYVAAVTS